MLLAAFEREVEIETAPDHVQGVLLTLIGILCRARVWEEGSSMYQNDDTLHSPEILFISVTFGGFALLVEWSTDDYDVAHSAQLRAPRDIRDERP